MIYAAMRKHIITIKLRNLYGNVVTHDDYKK